MEMSWLPLAAMLAASAPTLALAIRHRLRTGASPVVLTFDDSVFGFQSRLFRTLLIATAALLVLQAIWPQSTAEIFGSLPLLQTGPLKPIGLTILALGGGIVTLAQYQMDRSWRIGIPEEQRDPLVNRGLYRLSRNPIYLGILTGYIGLLLMLPNAATAMLLVAVYLSTATQIRLEEAFLTHQLGESYLHYRRAVRRWI